MMNASITQMREIKFRGLYVLKYKSYWIYGSLVDNPQTQSAFIFEQGEEDVYLVERKTVGQYTGLKDKNGKEIYEGDIVKTDGMQPFCVEYDIEYNGFNLYWDARPVELIPLKGNELEIIGNIHEGVKE